MANYYTQFSFAIDVEPEQEEALREAEEETTHLHDEEFPPDVLVKYGPIENRGEAFIQHPGGARGTPEDAGQLVSRFLDKIGSDETVTFTYANTCQKPRLDAFGGGYVVATREGYEIGSAYSDARSANSIAENEGTMRVQAEIDVEAETPEEAAQRAQEHFQEPGTTATVFDVFDPLKTRVDLLNQND
jgi:hypothetical protein